MGRSTSRSGSRSDDHHHHQPPDGPRQPAQGAVRDRPEVAPHPNGRRWPPPCGVRFRRRHVGCRSPSDVRARSGRLVSVEHAPRLRGNPHPPPTSPRNRYDPRTRGALGTTPERMPHVIEVELLGPPRVLRDGKPVLFDTRKAVALLAHLAVTARPRPRDSLADLLWTGTDLAHARGALRRTLSSVRTGVGRRSGAGHPRPRRPRPGAGLVVDVDVFRSLRESSPEDAVACSAATSWRASPCVTPPGSRTGRGRSPSSCARSWSRRSPASRSSVRAGATGWGPWRPRVAGSRLTRFTSRPTRR